MTTSTYRRIHWWPLSALTVVLVLVAMVARLPAVHRGKLWALKTPVPDERDPDSIERKEVALLEGEEIHKNTHDSTVTELRDSERINDCLDFHGPRWVLRRGREWLRICDLCLHECANTMRDREYGLQFLRYDPVQDRWIQVRVEIPWLEDKTARGLLEYLESKGWPVPLNYW